MLEAERAALAAACRRLAREGLVLATAGNVSVRAGDLVGVTPTGGVFERLEAGDMSVVDREGNLVEGPLEPTSELPLHLAVYERLDAGAVVHTHAPMATALSCVVDEVPAVHYSMLSFGGSVRVAPYATFGSDELAENVARALEGRAAALMQNHGAVCFAGDVESATELALLLEWACRVYWLARCVGEPRALSDAELGGVVETVARLGYGATKPAQ